jgi:hypothetical protein
MKGGYCKGTLGDSQATALGRELGGLYFCELKSSSEVFHKIGISKHSAFKRLNRECTTHEVNLLASHSCTLYEALVLEQKILLQHQSSKYRPESMKWGGHTECLKLTSSQVDSIRQIIEKADLSDPCCAE